MEREKFSSRLGFILISAGCAIGLGNVWRFPYITGKYGGAAFVLIYLFFLVILGLPIMVMEFAVGRASQKSAALSFDVLEPKGTKWHWYKWGAMAGNYLLMMFYTTIGGWMILYFAKMASGSFAGLDADGVAAEFGALMRQPGLMAFCMILVVVVCFLICAGGLQKGGAYHEGDDALPAVSDDYPCRAFCVPGGRRCRTGILSEAGFRQAGGDWRR